MVLAGAVRAAGTESGHVDLVDLVEARAAWAASTQVRPGAKAAPTTTETPRSRASVSRSSRPRTSAMVSAVDTTDWPRSTKRRASSAWFPTGPASTTLSVSTRIGEGPAVGDGPLAE